MRIARCSIMLFFLLFCIYTVNGHLYQDHHRYRRQITSDDINNQQQIDLNVTVPYIFSARLYSYGPARGDIAMNGRNEIYKLENPIHFMGNVYDSVYISRDGSIGFAAKPAKPSALPVEEPVIAVFWQTATLGNVWYRETDDVNIVNLAHNEVNIQYRYGSQFRVRSVVLITWENIKDPQIPEAEGNTFQLALIIGDTMTFAHFIYSKLNNNVNAIAGFSSHQNFYSLPDSATNDAILLSEKSDIGIPGEWLFRVDSQQIYLCGAGFKGLECIESCATSQWFNDCSKSCHCDGGDGCDQENGRCPNGKCSPGWRGEPICDVDLDECEMDLANCPNEQPDCLNTPGSFLCLCFEYDEERQMCKGSKVAEPSSAPIPVDVVPLQPSFTRVPATSVSATRQNRFKSTLAPTSKTTSSRIVASTTVTRVPNGNDINTPLLMTESSTRPSTTTSMTTVQTACSRCDQNAKCKNGVCECLEGYTGDGFRCYDIDECQIDGAVCGNHSICTNTIGSFDCSCYGGYRFEEGQCEDIDECRETPKICGDPTKGTRCINKDGSFECACRDGFEGDPSTECRDIDECLNRDACGSNSQCTNIEGGYECECLPGFERLAEGAHCTDRDECAVAPCHPAATCSNIRGSYKCECIDGFIGDGKTCHETILYPISNDSIVIPRSWDAVTTLPLNGNVTVFGKTYSKVYLSTNGILSFEDQHRGLVNHAEMSRTPAVFALHAQFDYAREGLIAYTFINGSDESTFALLQRSSMGVATSLGLEKFVTKKLHIFTFDRVKQAGSDNLNSFQIVLAEGTNDVTVLSLIYEKVQAKGPMTGISTFSRFLMLPNDRLTRGSNIGQPGKWMYRIDMKELNSCPPGRLGEPMCDRECDSGRYGLNCESTCHCEGSVACDTKTGYCPGNLCRAGWEGPSCDQDIDECTMKLVTCAHGSECVNTRGGYRCDCKSGFVQVGKQCQTIDNCLAHFGVPCATNAECLDLKCVCRQGFHGDGFRCVRTSSTSSIQHHLMDSGNHNNNMTSENTSEVVEVPEKPFVMKNWDGAGSTTSLNTPNVLQAIPPLYTAPPIKPKSEDKDNIMEGDKEKVEENDGMHLVFVILPAALIIIWLVLIFVVLVLCKMSKRKREARATSTQHYSRTWKTAPRERSLPSRNPNIIYGRTPRITTYEGY